MKLKEAIQHAQAQAAIGDDKCAKEHQQLADWLTELQQKRSAIKEMLDYIDKEGRRLSCNFASHAIGHSVKCIAAELRKMSEKK